MDKSGTSYVNYYKKQFLRAEDFIDEQLYHQAMRRRHNIAHHTWGIVYGLQVRLEEGGLVIEPGMAIDGYGRELILPEKRPIRTSQFVEKGSNILDVWLVYDRQGSDTPPPGYASCDPEESRGLFYRWQEAPLVRYTVANPDEVDRRSPPGVAAGDLPFAPFRNPVDDPLSEWMIFLGQIIYDPNDAKKPYSVDPGGRPYAGLVGEQVNAPSGETWLQVGHEEGEDTLRFGVFIPEAEPPPPPGEDPSPTQPRLSIDNTGEISLRGDTTITGNLTMVNGGIEFGVGEVRGEQEKTWRMYRAHDTMQVEDSEGKQQTLDTDDLRIEIAGGSSEGTNRLVIGSWSEQAKKFMPCLIVDDRCNLTVAGDLIIQGTSKGAIRTRMVKEGGLTEQARTYMIASTLSGIGGSSVILPEVINQRRFEILRGVQEIPPGEVAMFERRMAPAEENLPQFVNRLGEDDEQLNAFVARLNENPAVLQKLKDALGGA